MPGKAVGDALKRARAKVELHDVHFNQDALDEEWIPEVASRGWVILTKDKNIRRRLGEREAVIVSGARIFTLTSGNMRGEEMAARFIEHLRAMKTIARKEPPPFIAIVRAEGIEVIMRRPTNGPGEGSDENNAVNS